MRRSALFAAALVLGSCGSGSPERASSDTSTPVPWSTPGSSADVSSTLAADPERAADPKTNVPIEPLRGHYRVEVVQRHPHDASAYTQGLEWHEGQLLESTGQYGESTRRRVDIESGSVETIEFLDPDLFAEGITVVGDELVQLTWREGVLLRSSVDDLATVATQAYDGEGWGLCFDGDHLVMSDGTDRLMRRDPLSFAIETSIDVVDANGPVTGLNELECVGDQVLANVYGNDTIVVIDATTGMVDAVIDATELRPSEAPADDLDFVLNGIALDPGSGHYYLTGKYWPVLYEVRLVPSTE